MGLDSIELVMEIEKYFGIRIPDSEAENIYTIQKMVDSVAVHLKITNESMELRDKVLYKLSQAFQELGWATTEIELTHLASAYIPSNDKKVWSKLQNSLSLSIPEIEIVRKGSNKISDKLKTLINWTPSYEWDQITIEQFVAAICSNNYDELIDRNNIVTKYEIYIAIAGITVDKIGVDYYEIAPDKSFTTDLGID